MEFNATFMAAFVSFILFTIIMNLILYKPLNKVILERQKFVDDNYDEAKTKTAKSEAILRDKERKLENTKHEAKKILIDKTHEIKAKKSVMTSEAQQKASNTIDLAKNDLQKAKDEAQGLLSDKVVDLAQDISAKILGDNVSIQGVDKEQVNKMMQEG